jgi:hypothetical protein
VSAEAEAVAKKAAAGKPMSLEAMKALAARVADRHREIGYTDYRTWIRAHA